MNAASARAARRVVPAGGAGATCGLPVSPLTRRAHPA